MERELDDEWQQVTPLLVGIALFAGFILWKEKGDLYPSAAQRDTDLSL